MNRPIEDRLVAALQARAELVTPEDLRPEVLPAPPQHGRRRAVLLLAAAATAAVIATPFALGLDDGDGARPQPAGPPSAVPSPPGSSPSPLDPTPSDPTPSDLASDPASDPVAPAGESVVVDRQRADLDGDRRPDDVRVLLHAATADEPAEGSVQVTLASGATGAAALPFGYAPRLLPALDLDGDGGEQLLLSHTAGGDAAQLLVYTWHDEGLVRAETAEQVPLLLELDGLGRVADHYVEGGRLFSWRRLEPVGPGSTFRVEQWSWTLDGDRLVPAPAGERCVDVTTSGPPRRCP